MAAEIVILLQELAHHDLFASILNIVLPHESIPAVMTSPLPNSEVIHGESVSHVDDGQLANNKPVSLTPSSNGVPLNGAGGHATTMLDPTISESGTRGDGIVRKKLSKLLKDKEREWTAVYERDGPLRLLDLPMDILKEIVKEVSPP